MFKSLQTLDTGFSQVKTVAVAVILGAFLLCGFFGYLYFQGQMASNNRIYVLQGENLLVAGARDARADRPVEAKAHVKRFHELFFTLDPDQKAIDSNINKALYLADNSAKREYENLKEKGFYNDLIAANISMEITVDSVVLSKGSPFGATTYAHQRLIRATSIAKRNLISQCQLRDVTRSENNPHGFLIENWRVVQNNTEETLTR